MSTRGEYVKDLAIEAAASAIILPPLFGTLYAINGATFEAGAATGLITSLSISTFRLYTTSPATRRYAKVRARGKKAALESAFYSTAPGTVYQRGSWLADWWQSRKIRRMQAAEQAGADLRDNYAPVREWVLAYNVHGVQLTYPVVSKFLRQAERNRDRGRSFSARYWTQDCRAEWWFPQWYDPMMVLIRTAQAKSDIQLFHYNPGNGWSKLIYPAPFTYGVIREHWTNKRYIRM